MTRARTLGPLPVTPLGAVVIVAAFLSPLVFSDFVVGNLFTRALILGIVAASLIYLNADGGMVSLGQVALYGIAGFAMGNLTTNGNTKGLNLGWDPIPAVLVSVAIVVVLALLLGGLASRSVGIYFLMITLVYGVIANLFFGQVTTLSGFGGISGIPTPGVIGAAEAHPVRLYFVALVAALLLYALLRYVARTPFGLTLQGVRDDPVRMSSLGYNVPLHRTLAFTFAAFVAAIGGVLFVWWNGQIAPSSIDLTAMIDVLAIAVIGGLYRLEGAWVGALFFVILNNYAQQVDFIGERFATLVGIIFLAIVLVSPNGLIGLGERSVALRRRRTQESGEPVPASETTDGAGAVTQAVPDAQPAGARGETRGGGPAG